MRISLLLSRQNRPLLSPRFIAFWRFFLVVLLLSSGPVLAQSANNPSGLPLPRFASTRSDPVNVRVGPGVRYEIAWTYVKAGRPVEIIQEFDTWRKIRDVEGETGWIHQNLLSGRRVALVTPWASERTGLRRKADTSSGVRAWLGSGFLVGIDACEKAWCRVEARAKGRSYAGYIRQEKLWGVYPNENFD